MLWLMFYRIFLDVDMDTNYRVIPVWPSENLMLSADVSRFETPTIYLLCYIYIAHIPSAFLSEYQDSLRYSL